MNELALFAGAGGGLLASKLLGWRTVCAVEINDYCRRVLMQRQVDGLLEPFPIWDDVRTFDGKPWRGAVDIVSGGFPCQDISVAGGGAGIDGARSGLWREFARIIREVGPRFVFVENSPMLTSRGLHRVLADLAEMGFDAEWGCISAADAIWSSGAPAVYHDRYRIWIVGKSANADSQRESQQERGVKEIGRRIVNLGEEVGKSADADGISQQGQLRKITDKAEWTHKDKRPPGSLCVRENWWQAEPSVGRVVNGVAHRMDRLKAIGNGQVPAVAAAAFRILKQSNWSTNKDR